MDFILWCVRPLFLLVYNLNTDLFLVIILITTYF